jgi:FkbM family methyltransferase
MRQIARQLLRNRMLSELGALTARAGGNRHLARRIELIGGKRLPDIVEDALPSAIFARPLVRMATQGGKDQVARSLWTHGWAHFEAPLPLVFGALARNARGVADIGANTGYYSLLAAAANPDAEIYAFEPVPTIATLTRANATLNQAGKIRVLECAISDAAGSFELFLPVDDHGLIECSASLNPEFRAEHSEALTVQVTRLDDVLPGVPIDLIKIDVESFEAHVVRGAEQLIREHRPAIVVEVLETDAELAALVKAIDYTPYYLFVDRVRKGEALVADPASANILLLPKEKAEQLSSILAPTGLSIR